MKNSTISVIIPCFNAERWIREALQSALGQGIDDIEIIVVDDGSTDNSASIIEKEFPSVHLVRTGHQGAGKARNIGTRLSKGEFIQYLDADDLLAPGKLKIQLKALQESGADIAYGNWQNLIKLKTGEYVRNKIIVKKLVNPEIEIAICQFICPPAVYLFRRSIIEKIGGWDESLFIVQDGRFFFDCVVHKAKFVYCDNIMAYYREHPDSLFHRDPIASNRDMFKYASGIEEWWMVHGGIDDERRKALLRLYGHVARTSFEKDRNTFERVYKVLQRLCPGYIPERPMHLRLMSRILGYRRAETVAVLHRRIRLFLFPFRYRRLK